MSSRSNEPDLDDEADIDEDALAFGAGIAGSIADADASAPDEGGELAFGAGNASKSESDEADDGAKGGLGSTDDPGWAAPASPEPAVGLLADMAEAEFEQLDDDSPFDDIADDGGLGSSGAMGDDGADDTFDFE